MIFIKIISILIMIIMGICAFHPLYFALFYNFFRPIVQPWAINHYALFPGGQITALFSLLFIAITMFLVILKKEYKLFPPNVLPLYLLLYFSICSFLNSTDIILSIANILKIFTGVAMYVLTYNAVKSPEDAKKVLWGLQISTIIPMLYGYYQYFTGTGSSYGGDIANRVGSFFHQPNAMGEFICINLCASFLLLFIEKTRWKRIALFIIIGSMLVSLLLSLHRGSWIALSTAFIIAYFPFFKKVKLRWYLISGLLIVITAMPIIINRFNQLSQINQWGQSRNTFSGRVDFWKILLKMVPEHPFVGYGIGITEKMFPTIPHNDFIRLLFETGVFGVFFYIIYIFVEWFHNIVNIKKKECWYIYYSALVCTTYWIIISFAQNLIFSVSILPVFMMFLGVTRKYPFIDKKNNYN